MQRFLISTIASLIIATLMLAACASIPEHEETTAPYTPVESSEPETTVQREAAFHAALQSLPYDLPAGYSSPNAAPSFDFPGTFPVDDSSGEQQALRWFVCTKVLAAWDEASVGNIEAANSHLSDVVQAAQEDPRLRSMRPDTSAWSDPEAATSGDIALCSQWFDLIAE